MNVRSWFCCFIAIIFVLVSGCSGQGPDKQPDVVPQTLYTNETHGLTVAVPAGWIAVDADRPELFEMLGGTLPGFIAAFAERDAGETSFIQLQFNILPEAVSIEDKAAYLRERNSLMGRSGVTLIENAAPVMLVTTPAVRTVMKTGEQEHFFFHFIKGRILYSIILSMRGPEALDLRESFVSQIRIDDTIVERPFDLLNVEDMMLLALQHFKIGQFDEAIMFGEEALTRKPDDKLKSQILFNLSSSYLEKGIPVYAENRDASYYQKALGYAQRALALRPTDWKILGNIATLHMNMGNLEEADRYFTEAEKYADPKSPYYNQLIGTHQMMMGIEKARTEAKNSAG